MSWHSNRMMLKTHDWKPVTSKNMWDYKGLTKVKLEIFKCSRCYQIYYKKPTGDHNIRVAQMVSCDEKIVQSVLES